MPGSTTSANATHSEYSPRIVSGDDADAARLLAELAALGLQRALLPWRRGEAPAYPRQATPTAQSKLVWLGEVAKEHKTAAAELKKQAAAALSVVQKRSDALLSELKTRYKAIDEAHTAALWARVRDLFDYPVFIAAPKTVGITSTGETGDGVASELPVLLRAYRDFEKWIENGEQPEATPNFQVPSAA
jgi:type I restriction enzyme M protein